MVSITIDLSDNQFQKLQALAQAYRIAPENLLRASVDDWLNSQTDEFSDVADYILKKNAELYRRLV